MNSKTVKKDFPIFAENPGLVYLDSAAMSLKPDPVIKAVDSYYRKYSANVFRGVYSLSEQATVEYEKARDAVASFIHAPDREEVIFLRNSSEAINLVAYTWGREHIDEKSEILTTVMEHHSNFVPWQALAGENGATLKILDVDDEGILKTEGLEEVVTGKTKLLAITWVSNALGTINPLKSIIRRVKARHPGIVVLVDAAQAVPHMKVDVRDLGCDFLVFSGQKMLGPTGAGALWGRRELLEAMPPFLYGGEMIREVHLDRTVFAGVPHKFEAGTPHIAGAIGLGAAVSYLNNLGLDAVREHEKELTEYALKKLAAVRKLTLYGPEDAKMRSGVISFNLEGVHAHDVAAVLDEHKICVRSGHHCAMPLHERLGLDATVRASLYMYNTKEDIDALADALDDAGNLFAK